MDFRAPIEDIAFAMAQAAGAQRGGLWPELADGTAESVLAEAGRFAQEKLAPLNRIGDRQPARLTECGVVTPPGWRGAYDIWRAGGWAGLAAPSRFGGAGLSHLLLSACLDVWNGANMAFMLGPLLSFAAIDALKEHADPRVQSIFLRRLVSGEWTATMNLTEPQAGSDLSDVRMRAVPFGDGTYRLFGQKIFITYGDHDLTDNIVHLALARLPDAPAGAKGISLFLAPKIRVEDDGRPGSRNDLRCAGLEHKLGIHGAPTCAMIFGESDGAEAWLVGEPNRGLACMFTMMNNARLAVGLQGVGVCEAATQAALNFARERIQGRAPGAGPRRSPIIDHPDVRRMLMTMKASTAAARAICYRTAAAVDASAIDGADAAAASERAALLTPVAKAYSTDLANDVASLAVQVHGGMGYIEETGIAQLLRDARICAVYEGTNGIQAIDLVQRKLPMRGGVAVRSEIESMRRALSVLGGSNLPGFGATAPRLADAVESLVRATEWLLQALNENRLADALAGAGPYLRLFALARGGVSLAENALAGAGESGRPGRIALARFYAEHMAVGAHGLADSVVAGAESVLSADPALAAVP